LYNNPVFGEGNNNNQHYWAGYIDGAEGQLKNKNNTKLVVDIELINIHPKTTTHGVGYYERYFVSPDPVWSGYRSEQYRNYRSMEIAFGRAGFIPSPAKGIPFDEILKEYYLMTELQARYTNYTADTIEYPNTTSGSIYVGLSEALKNNNGFSQLHVNYSSGLNIYVNKNDTEWILPLNSINYTLPKYGWLAYNDADNFIAYYAKVNNTYKEYINSSLYEFVNYPKSPDAKVYVDFGENKGATANDESGWNNDVNIGSCAIWSDGKIDKALRYLENCTNPSIISESESLLTNSTITVAFWVNWQNASRIDYVGLFKRGRHDAGSVWAYIYQKQFVFDAVGSDSTISPQTIIETLNNTWYFYTGVINDTHINLYIDGILQQSIQKSGTGYATSSSNITIGAVDSTELFDGIIDELRIYAKALDDAQVLDLYANSLDGYINYSYKTQKKYGFYNYKRDSLNYTIATKNDAWDYVSKKILCTNCNNANITVSGLNGIFYEDLNISKFALSQTGMATIYSMSNIAIDRCVPVQITYAS
ncbi:MAG: LamG domain-containing protein, partial [Candidatus Aenigmarchaeota archaeon]|nr:LamG domain-containing protein [Candidatus Aenigmarchaeota archaeon]